MPIHLKRAYEPPSQTAGCRILVERLWPRGVSKSGAQIDLWVKDAAPSTELRKWFSHDPDKWEEFKKRYYAELAEHPDVLTPIHEAMDRGAVTFVFASREERLNSAAALKALIESSR